MTELWETALRIASRTTHPYAVAAFGLVFIAMALLASFKLKKSSISWLLAPILLAVTIAPLIASTYLESRGVYRIRIVVLGTDGRPNDNAVVTSSVGGELKKLTGSYELDLAPQAKPSNGLIVFYASLKDAYLAGDSTLLLTRDFYPTLAIKLSPLPQVVIRGTVVYLDGQSVPGARVSVAGYPDIAVTDAMGNFSLPSHHSDGQQVRLRVEKGTLITEMSVLAGPDVELVLGEGGR